MRWLQLNAGIHRSVGTKDVAQVLVDSDVVLQQVAALQSEGPVSARGANLHSLTTCSSGRKGPDMADRVPAAERRAEGGRTWLAQSTTHLQAMDCETPLTVGLTHASNSMKQKLLRVTAAHQMISHRPSPSSQKSIAPAHRQYVRIQYTLMVSCMSTKVGSASAAAVYSPYLHSGHRLLMVMKKLPVIGV